MCSLHCYDWCNMFMNYYWLINLLSWLYQLYLIWIFLPEIDQAQLLTENNETTASGVGVDETHDNNDSTSLDDELRKMLADIFVDNARLRKQVNSVTRHALRVDIMSKKEDKEAASSKFVVNTSVL